MAARTWWGRKIGIDVDEDGARNVTRLITPPSLAALPQVPADVGDPELRVIQPRRKLLGRDQW
jgi:hypothetical protein